MKRYTMSCMMKALLLVLLSLHLTLTGYGQQAGGTGAISRGVFINGEKISAETLAALEKQYFIHIQDGHYWYDKISGLWGLVCGPALGIALPGLQIGGQLQSDAANGNSGVFINGLELHWQDVQNLQQWVGYAYPGRYWLDAYGNVGYEGGPAFLNLWQLASRQQNTYYHNNYTGISAGSSGGISYVMGKDFSVILDH